jgi:hypothetical protein
MIMCCIAICLTVCITVIIDCIITVIIAQILKNDGNDVKFICLCAFSLHAFFPYVAFQIFQDTLNASKLVIVFVSLKTFYINLKTENVLCRFLFENY